MKTKNRAWRNVRLAFMGTVIGMMTMAGSTRATSTRRSLRAAEPPSAMMADDAQERVEWLGRAVIEAGVLFWTKNASGHYTGVNDYYFASFPEWDGDVSRVIGSTDDDLIAIIAGNRTIDDFKNVKPGETFASIAETWRKNDLQVQESGKPTRFIERCLGDGRAYSVVSVKSPFEGGTAGVAIPLFAENEVDVIDAGPAKPPMFDDASSP